MTIWRSQRNLCKGVRLLQQDVQELLEKPLCHSKEEDGDEGEDDEELENIALWSGGLCLPFDPDEYVGAVTIKTDQGGSGERFVASRDLDAGTLVLAECAIATGVKAVSFYRSLYNDASASEADLPMGIDTAGVLSALVDVILVAAEESTKALRDVFGKLKGLYPRTKKELKQLGKWESGETRGILDRHLDKELTDMLQRIRGRVDIDDPAREKERLKWVVSLNALGMYQQSEQFCYSKAGFDKMEAVGLFFLASFFNHSCSPNVCRYSISEWMLFHTIKPVKKGEPLTISYVEEEHLEEPLWLRRAVLAENGYQRFKCVCPKCVEQRDDPSQTEEGCPVMQPFQDGFDEELLKLPPNQRLQHIQEVKSAVEEALQTRRVLLSDRIQLSLMEGAAHAQLRNFDEADRAWGRAYEVATEALPDNDEHLVALSTLLACCAACLPPSEQSHFMLETWLATAVRIHSVCFGGGVHLYRQRYRVELQQLDNFPPDTHDTVREAISSVLTRLECAEMRQRVVARRKRKILHRMFVWTKRRRPA
ncbi:unnamed protein product [Vitrella brassicaformis CCMP3155]|uniref:SET domain-containing protein n=1 Tax=Vitrella brassicaformis (strain CCMP3155) TaxID=1169540 RepID=A0A0G4FR69_VITBC|nr:unnamed protein product [Vitrella brassicaformis CCMP3155]|eukprot:CEM16731.1 unnamed protein product [Vitrella brassicaformis CCMP3155]